MVASAPPNESRLQVFIQLLLFSSPTLGWQVSTDRIQRLESPDLFDAVSYYQQNTPVPLLIANALSPSVCEDCSESLLSIQDSSTVELQHQKRNRHYSSTGSTTTTTRLETNVYEASLRDALNAVLFASTSQSAYLMFSEGLPIDPVIADHTQKAREQLFSDGDWFARYFPPQLCPTDAVVLAGIGATSTLHRDPFHWMGTSLCLEGSKVWRFVDPGNGSVAEIDRALESYRLPSVAWQDDTVSLSAGWQSDKSLFRHCQYDHTSKDLATMDSNAKKQLLTEIASSTDILAPDTSIADDVVFATVVQEAGDLLLIPPHWWHQTISLEPSAAIASQRCGNNEGSMVLQHMLDWNHRDDIVAKDLLQSMDPQRAVDYVLNLLQEARLTQSDARTS